MTANRIYWRCRKNGGHVVGELRDVTLIDGAGHVVALVLYEQAIVTAPPDNAPPLRAEKIYHAEGLVCSLCGRTFDWYPSLSSLTKLMKRYEKP